MLAVYLLVGRKLRQGTSLLGYVYPTYVLAAITLGVIVFAAKSPIFVYSERTYLFLLMLGLVPQCIGHTCYNWALRYLSATLVSIVILGEPVLATIMAWWVLGETVGPVIYLGAVLVGLGIFTVSRWGFHQPQLHSGH
jgi:drug/metabolite transporter (DMT)-like permease